jgi:hypothetical protein
MLMVLDRSGAHGRSSRLGAAKVVGRWDDPTGEPRLYVSIILHKNRRREATQGSTDKYTECKEDETKSKAKDKERRNMI